MKTCFKCGVTKELSEFYKHRKMADGHLGKCKECARKDARDNRRSNIGKYREHDRRRSKLPHRVSLRKTCAMSWREKNPRKYSAHNALNNALRDGRITRKDHCEVCGSTFSVVAHHDDYRKPLDVRWLCQACHCQWHALAELDEDAGIGVPF